METGRHILSPNIPVLWLPWSQAGLWAQRCSRPRPYPQQFPGWEETDTENGLMGEANSHGCQGEGSLRVVPATTLQLVPVVGRIMVPKAINILIPATCDCYLIRMAKRVCRCR